MKTALTDQQWVNLQQSAIAMMKLYGSENVLAAVEATLKSDWGLSEAQKHDLNIACAFLALAQQRIEKIAVLPLAQSHSDSL